MDPRRRLGRSPPRKRERQASPANYSNRHLWRSPPRERDFAPSWTGAPSPPAAFLERSPSPPLPLRRYIDDSREEPYGPRPRFEPWHVSSPSGQRREADSFGNGFLGHDWPEYSREGNYGTPKGFLELADSFPGQSRFDCGRGDDFRRPNRSLPRSPMDWDLPRGHSPFFADEGRGHVQSRDDTFDRSGRGDGFEAAPRPRSFERPHRTPMEPGAEFPERSHAIILEGKRRWTPSPQDRRRGALSPGSDGHDPWTQRSMERLGQQSSPRGDRGGSFLETGDRGEPYPLGPPPPHNLGGGRGGFPPRRFFRGRGGLQQTGPPGGSGRQRSPRQSLVLPALRTEPEASGRKAFPRKRSEKQVAGAIKSTGVEEPERPWESKHDDSNGAVRLRPEAADNEGAIKPEATVDEGDGSVTSGLIAGMCTDVQKGYLRLTGPPDATKIRPKLVLPPSGNTCHQNG
ncbi:translation initiation factor IF-2-like isoform X1 [Triticum dicoccoides]|uniref:translation initiation factor IF-2-like isoform X1 n=1 Tax=Triticum dicoccoides TaxID=85692 RepID=UPI00189118D2|nr:translation initiation factor IF-2-like isoform X1 [Triticum dicoccoides]